MTENEQIILSPTQERMTIAQILIALLDSSNSLTNKEISDKTGLKQSQVSSIATQMENYKLILIEKGLSYDQRVNKVKLTPLGKAQAMLALLSAKTIPGRDELAESVIKQLEKITKKG